MLKSFVKFALILIVAQVVTYVIGGVIAQFVLGANEFYPPSPNAISYLRDPHKISMGLEIIPAQALRGLLFALVLFPFRKQLVEMGTWAGGLLFGAIIFVIGFVAGSGGMIESLVYFSNYPVKFAMITFVEILIQAILMGPWVVAWIKRYRVSQETLVERATWNVS
jgi:hypothetical protein